MKLCQRFHSCVSTPLIKVSAILVLAASAFGQIATTAANRPANIPEGYVITPFGYFHQSCVKTLAKGESMLADGRIQHTDGTTDTRLPDCSYQHYAPPGGSQSPSSSEVNGWVENANINTGSPSISYGALIARWTVPSQPGANDNQVIYLFPGLQDITNTESILQPVLQWWQGQWSIASWNCCLSGIAVQSQTVNVNTADEIYGSVTSNCAAGTLSCDTWNVLTLDLTTGDSTTLGYTPSDGQIFNWAFSGVMEVYSVVSCEDYPSDHQIRFDHVKLFDQYLNPLSAVQWTNAVDTTQKPHCHYQATSKSNEVTLRY